MRVNEPEENVRLKVGDVASKALRVVKPSEILKAELSVSELKKLKKDTKEMEVDCQKKGGG